MANIKQVANLANLSVSCVSKYLKNPKSVLPSSRKQIEHAIEELQYVPSTVARNLRNKRTGIIKIISHSITNQFFAEFFEAIRMELEKNDYIGSLHTIGHDDAKLFSAKDFEQIDGVIICFLEHQESLNSIEKNVPSHLPVINIHGEKSVQQFTTILTDVTQGSFEATEHLMCQGGTHLAYIGGYKDNTMSILKKAGFSKAIETHGPDIEHIISDNNKFSMQSGFDATQRLYEKESTIDAIFCENDLLAAGAIHFLHDIGKKVPEDVRVIGYDNIPLASMFIPAISSVSIPIKEMSTLAVSKLFDQMEMRECEDGYFAPHLFIRSST